MGIIRNIILLFFRNSKSHFTEKIRGSEKIKPPEMKHNSSDKKSKDA